MFAVRTKANVPPDPIVARSGTLPAREVRSHLGHRVANPTRSGDYE